MDDDDNDNLYGESSPTVTQPNLSVQQLLTPNSSTPKPGDVPPNLRAGSTSDLNSQSSLKNSTLPPDDNEEFEEEEVEVEEDEDDDIEFVLERKDGEKAEPPPAPSRYNLRMAPAPTSQRGPSASETPKTRNAQPVKPAGPRLPTPPPTATSTLDLKAVPIHPSTNEPLTSISIDSIPSKPWRNPGADVTDYFNYGFDEFTWTAYCQKQESVRAEFDPKKMMEEMMMMGSMMGDPTAMMAMMGSGPGGQPEMPGMIPPPIPGFGMEMMAGAASVPQAMDMTGQHGGQGMYNQQSGMGGYQAGGMGQYGQGMGQSGYDEQQRYMQQQQRMQQQQPPRPNMPPQMGNMNHNAMNMNMNQMNQMSQMNPHQHQQVHQQMGGYNPQQQQQQQQQQNMYNNYAQQGRGRGGPVRGW